ncbi:MAG TPA: hypothetical protein VK681_27480 [Reyranella sp.]|nr:hypothetical protein [Reyranella sp.]
MAQVQIFRSDQVSIGVTVAGMSLPNESWDVLEGAEKTVEGLTVMPGGQLPQRALGGIAKRGPATVKKLWSAPILLVYKELEETAGQALITITYSVKPSAKASAVFSETYTGITGTVSRPNYDAEKSEVAYMTLMADLDGDSQ